MLSVVINVKNSEQYIKQCLDALVRFDDIVIVDNYSTDNTLKIVKEYNVRIFQTEFCAMGKLRNIAASYAKHKWLFFVDSDEVVESRLVDKILTMKFLSKHIYQVRRINFYNNLKINTSSWQNDWVSRIYNRLDTEFSENNVHESVKITSSTTIKKIEEGALYHFPYNNVEQLVNKMQFYSSLYAKQYINQKNPSLFLIPFRAFIAFIKCYFLKKGFLQGYAGFVISSYNAIGVFTKYIKLYELMHQKSFILAIDVTDDIKQIKEIVYRINSQKLLPKKVLLIGTINQDTRKQINLVTSYEIVNRLSEIDKNVIYIKDYEQLNVNYCKNIIK